MILSSQRLWPRSESFWVAFIVLFLGNYIAALVSPAGWDLVIVFSCRDLKLSLDRSHRFVGRICRCLPVFCAAVIHNELGTSLLR